MPGWEIIGKDEKNALIQLINEGGCLFAHGFFNHRKRYHVREFEKELSKKFKSKYSLVVSSGTSATKIALKSLGVKRGDEVITQSFNFVATIEAILETGAKPVICDINETLNMCPVDLKRKISKKTKVILPVHMLGVSAEMSKIMQVAKKNKIKVLEDNCESVGGKFNNKYLGTIADIGVLSFDFSKTITTGEGGAILTNKKDLDKFCREYHDHGHQNNKKFPRGMDTVKIQGFNYRITEMQASVGKIQLKKLNFILNENKRKYKILEDQLKYIVKLRNIPNASKPIYDTFIFSLKDKTKKNKIIKYLKKNIGTKNLPDAIKWHCSYFWKHMLGKKQIKNSLKTKKILENNLSIPILLNVSDKLYLNIAKKIKEIIHS